jgi:hypothetical protein
LSSGIIIVVRCLTRKGPGEIVQYIMNGPRRTFMRRAIG